MIQITNLKKDYTSKTGVTTNALKGINLNIREKGLVFIIGKSGSGKSTLLNVLGGLDNITEGQILINNKDLTKFNEKELDSYRNTYVGFVFQDFNLLEQYSVSENIELANSLQGKETYKEELENLLTKLEINEFKDRKINELSGGQKQRVSIARALIKKPNLLLCDEPTGNLDINTGAQIFNVLQEISKERLVIVVSHDLDSARKYANRIIQIEDGNIVNDANAIQEETVTNNIELIKSKLPIKYAFKMVKKNLLLKKKKLFATIIIAAFTLIFMGFTTNLALFKESRLVANYLKDNELYRYEIRKYEDNDSALFKLNESDEQKIKEITNAKLNKAYILNNNEQSLNFEYGETTKSMTSEQEKIYSNRLDYDFQELNFIEVENDNLLKNIIGKIPQNSNEIVIHKYMADFMIEFGVKTYEEEIYFPKSYEELINSRKELKLGDNKIIISGIMNDNDELFKKLKNGEKLNLEQNNEVDEIYCFIADDVYVKGFTSTAKLNHNKNSITKNMGIMDTPNSELKILEKPIQAVTKNGIEEVSVLQKNEVIVTLDDLKVFDLLFDMKFNDYMLEHKDKVYEELINEFIQVYLTTEADVIKKPDLYTVFMGDNHNKYILNIVGVSLDNNQYVSNDFLKAYNPVEKYISKIVVYDDNMNNTINSLDKMYLNTDFDLIDEKEIYGYTFLRYGSLTTITETYKIARIVLFVLAMLFMVFSFLQFGNFVGISISNNKKDIGILRAIGASEKDIVKIYGYESITLAIISWLISLVGYILSIFLVNKYIGVTEPYILKVVVLDPFSIIIMLVIIVAISLLVSTSYIRKVSSIKPIDVILNK